MSEETRARAQESVAAWHAGEFEAPYWGDTAKADREWFRRHRPTKERVRPATVKEQTWLFKKDGGEVFDNVRVTEEIVVDRDFYFVHVVDPA